VACFNSVGFPSDENAKHLRESARDPREIAMALVTWILALLGVAAAFGIALVILYLLGTGIANLAHRQDRHRPLHRG
jgi:Na+/proline symporter